MAKSGALHHPVTTPNLDRLIAELDADLDRRSHGFNWLQAPPALRILVSDYAIDAAYTCRHSLREASYHLQEFEHAMTARKRTYMAYARNVPSGRQPEPHDPPSNKQELEYLRRDVNAVGFFRAIGSAFDNLGVPICVVGGLPISIIDRFTFQKLRGDAPGIAKKLTVAEQIELLTTLDSTITGAGPIGWDDWTIEMRNMLVHRPRRLWIGIAQPTNRQGRVESISMDFFLPRSPEWTDVEVWRGMTSLVEALLPDSAADTMAGVHASAIQLAEGMSTALLGIAAARRANNALITQPNIQWRASTIPKPSCSSQFRGYDSDESKTSVSHIIMSAADAKRAEAASVLTPRGRDLWPDWLAQLTSSRKSTP